MLVRREQLEDIHEPSGGVRDLERLQRPGKRQLLPKVASTENRK